MKICSKCKTGMERLKSSTPEGFSYEYYRCSKCGEEILDMSQLHKVAGRYRKAKQYHVRLTKWGNSLGLRLPKDISDKYHLSDKDDVILIQEKDGIKIIMA